MYETELNNLRPTKKTQEFAKKNPSNVSSMLNENCEVLAPLLGASRLRNHFPSPY